jgi:hypothetical protein
MHTIMAEVIEKVMDVHGLGCWWGVCGYGFWYLRFRWTLSVGVSMSSASGEITSKMQPGNRIYYSTIH